MMKLASMFVDVKADSTPFDKAMSSMQSSMSRTSVAVGTLAGNIATSIVKAAAGMGSSLFSGTISSASTLNESISKVGTVFGDQSSIVMAQAEQMAAKFGLPKQAMLDASATLGLFAQGAGKSDAEAAKFSNTMVKLASDAMSFYNVPFDQALQKIQAGLSGESEPLRAFGVFLTEDKVAAEALAMGLAKSSKELDDGAKIMARSSLIAKGMAKAQGDLERTSGGTENQSRKLWGTLENLGTTIGTSLLPAFNKLLEVGNAAMSGLMGAWDSSKATVEGWVSSVVGAFDTAGVMWRNLGDVWQIGRIKLSESLVNMVAAIAVLPENIGTIAKYVGRNFFNFIVDGINLSLAAFKNFFANVTGLGSAIGKWLADPFSGLEFKWTPLTEGFTAVTESLPELAKPAWVSYQDEIDKIGRKIADKEAKLAADIAAGAQKAIKPVAAMGGVNPPAPAADKDKKKAKEKATDTWSSRTFDASGFAEELRAKQLAAVGSASVAAQAPGNAMARAADKFGGERDADAQIDMLKELRDLNQTMRQILQAKMPLKVVGVLGP